MYTIESAEWKSVKPLWEEWRTYDLLKPMVMAGEKKIDKVWIDPADIFSIQETKTIVLKKDHKIIGILQIQDFSSFCPPIRVAGIGHVAVKHKYRNSGAGTKLMEIADLYLRFLEYDLSILYSSVYASRYGFYEKFGYKRYDHKFIFEGKIRMVHLKYYNNEIRLNVLNLNQLIKDIGKF